MYCKNCGEQINDNESVCPKCGEQLSPAADSKRPHLNTHGLEERSIVLAIVLSFVTCGIYSIYWFIRLTDEMNQVSGVNDTSGVKAFLFNLITFGIYGLYWAYKMGEKRDIVTGEHASSNIIYLLLTIFGVGIVVDILCQDTLNKAIANR
jgi:hypothetical protein